MSDVKYTYAVARIRAMEMSLFNSAMIEQLLAMKDYDCLLYTSIVTVLIIGFHIFTGGMYLAGVPDADEVRRVTIAYPEKTDKVKEITDGEQIDLAVKLTGFLRYSLFELSLIHILPGRYSTGWGLRSCLWPVRRLCFSAISACIL